MGQARQVAGEPVRRGVGSDMRGMILKQTKGVAVGIDAFGR